MIQTQIELGRAFLPRPAAERKGRPIGLRHRNPASRAAGVSGGTSSKISAAHSRGCFEVHGPLSDARRESYLKVMSAGGVLRTRAAGHGVLSRRLQYLRRGWD
jgi:hypothetical protein